MSVIFCERKKNYNKKNTYEIYWTMFGKFLGQYQYAKVSLIKSGL